MRLLLTLIAIPAFAGNNYYVTKSGNDSTGNGSQGAPWLTIAKCTGSMIAGDTCTISAGTYAEHVTIGAGGGTSTYQTLQANGTDLVYILDATIASYTKLIGFHIQNPSSPASSPCVDIPLATTDAFITNNNMYACGTSGMIKEEYAAGPSAITRIYIQGNTLSYSCSTSSTPNVCAAMELVGDHHLIEHNDISHVSDGPYIDGAYIVYRSNTFHDLTDADCGVISSNCHIDFTQSDNGGIPSTGAHDQVFENNTVHDMVVTGAVAGSGMHAGPLLQAESCGGMCQNAIIRFHTAYHIYGGGTTNDNSGTTPPPQAWINVKSYNNSWIDMLVGFTGTGWGVNGHTHGSFGASNLNELYWFASSGANQSNPYYCTDTACTPFVYGYSLAYCTAVPCTLYGHAYGTGAFTADAGNLSADPKFVNYSGNNFSLAVGSPAIASGTYLTTVASGDTGSGTSLLVNDAGFFQDGFGLTGVSGDCISVTTTGSHVCITVVNHGSNTLTLANAITRSSGDPIWLYSDSSGTVQLTGAAPNIGAHGPGSVGPPPATLSTALARGAQIR